jgi:rhodanese-related sulfurtransferase
MSSPSPTSVTCHDLYDLSQREEVDVIDVRLPTEFRHVHATIARNVPLHSLDPAAIMAERNGTAEQPLYVICKSGDRSSMACDKFAAAGYTNVVNVEGGTLGWEKAGLPVERGRWAVSLERQVRTVAGTMVLAGVALGWTASPYWYALSAWVGLGLVFSGMTNTCPMGTLLAKMPWNR